MHGSYYSAEFIFPDFPGQNESFSLTNLFMQNTNRTRKKNGETNLKV